MYVVWQSKAPGTSTIEHVYVHCEHGSDWFAQFDATNRSHSCSGQTLVDVSGPKTPEPRQETLVSSSTTAASVSIVMLGVSLACLECSIRIMSSPLPHIV